MTGARRQIFTGRREGFLVLAVALLMTWWLDETPSELVWGYWICAMLVPLVLVTSFIIGRIRLGWFTLTNFLGTATAIGLLGWTFLLFHRVYGDMLHGFYPVHPNPDRIYLGNLTWTHSQPFAYWPDALHVLKTYYWIALLSLWSVRSIIMEQLKGIDPAPDSPQMEDFCKFLLRMQLLIFVLLGVEIALAVAFGTQRPNVNGFAHAMLIQIVAYFPLPNPARTRDTT